MSNRQDGLSVLTGPNQASSIESLLELKKMSSTYGPSCSVQFLPTTKFEQIKEMCHFPFVSQNSTRQSFLKKLFIVFWIFYNFVLVFVEKLILGLGWVSGCPSGAHQQILLLRYCLVGENIREYENLLCLDFVNE